MKILLLTALTILSLTTLASAADRQVELRIDNGDTSETYTAPMDGYVHFPVTAGWLQTCVISVSLERENMGQPLNPPTARFTINQTNQELYSVTLPYTPGKEVQLLKSAKLTITAKISEEIQGSSADKKGS